MEVQEEKCGGTRRKYLVLFFLWKVRGFTCPIVWKR